MTLEKLEKMAQQTAAFGVHPSGEYIYSFYTEQLQAFAALVASAERESLRESFRVVTAAEASAAILHEREACAKLLEQAAEAAKNADSQGFVWQAVKASAEVIRARGQA